MELDREVDLLDKDLRPWMEECDSLQGVVIVGGSDDAWGGFGGKYVERVRDELGKGGVWMWGVEGEGARLTRGQQSLRSVNTARTMDQMVEHASMFVPISIPSAPLPSYVRLDRNSEWHTSALLSAALESMTIPTRMKPEGQRRGLLNDLEVALNVNGNQRIANLQCSFLDPETELPKFTKKRGDDDQRIRSDTNGLLLEENGPGETDTNLDIDLSMSGTAGRRTSKHTFGVVESFRGKIRDMTGDSDGVNADEIAYSRKRRPLDGLPFTERSVLLFTMSSRTSKFFVH